MSGTQPDEEHPESDYSRQTVKRHGMRTGYTTGSCAAAAAKAAALTLLTGQPVHEVTIHLPVGRDVTFTLHRCQWVDTGRQVLCSVIKDGGDDPDATHGAEICVTVSLAPAGQTGLRIVGGPGVGMVTRPGTGIPVGEPAVTRVPRRMMAESLQEAARSQALPEDTGFIAEVSVTGGEEIAKKTTNSRLGVMGGISILGSTGVVQPFSTAAWRASVHLAIDVAAANGLTHMVLSTGTRSEEYAKGCLDLPDMAYVDAGIFSGPALKRCVMRQIPRATHVGMVGKFSKMAMGYFVTHVAGNRVDPVFLASLAGQCGASPQVQEEMRGAASGRHFQEIAQANGLLSVFPLMCQMVCQESLKLLGDDAGTLVVDALCFDFDGTLLGHASTSPEGVPLVAGSGRR
ncbi:MAG: cobalt-precorrin-5B (C(1))-methyltransferase [Dehalococcoidia bacterium]|nr:cobalt-precorrin-5B (C(1))-methyltransferase [Dehalococcoidia bacterium]MSQ16073.1 cobalt-precorrin-5B (C(1))-methyltransferase [Dehalococcoidia bacterium]